jgi:hypothetical protein
MGLQTQPELVVDTAVLAVLFLLPVVEREITMVLMLLVQAEGGLVTVTI